MSAPKDQPQLSEWPTAETTPTEHWLTSLPADTPLRDLARLAKMRWRIGHDYREMKHGLGLDHVEGRTWRGWHHHTTLVTAPTPSSPSAAWTQKQQRRPDLPPSPPHHAGPAAVLDRRLPHLPPPVTNTDQETTPPTQINLTNYC